MAEICFEDILDPNKTPYVELRLVTLNSITGQGKNETISFELQEGGYSFKVTSGSTQIKRGPKKQVQREYPIQEWMEQLSWRLNKGWVPISTSKRGVVEVSVDGEYKSLDDSQLNDFIELLIQANDEYIATNYTVKIENIPLEDIDRAQGILLKLSENKDRIPVAIFNKALMEVWTIIPRPMAQMKKLLASDVSDYDSIIVREQEMLDNLQQMLRSSSKSGGNKTVLEAHDIEMRAVTDEEADYIKKLLTDKASHFNRAWRVSNKNTEKVFNDYCAEEGLSEGHGINHLFHGSGFCNWWSIMKTGLYLNPALVKPNVSICGKAFGYGIYFAPYAGKSLHYTDGSMYSQNGARSHQYLAIFKVATGNPYYIYEDTTRHKTPHNWIDFHEDHPGMHCCWAGADKDGSDKGLRRLTWDEVIVYQEKQCTIEYLIEMN